jgi:hypothetical protein
MTKITKAETVIADMKELGLFVGSETETAIFMLANDSDNEWRVDRRTGRVTARSYNHETLHWTRWRVANW